MIRAEDLVFEIGDFRLTVPEFEVERGEYFVLLGPPGSGKSIFLECLSGLKRPGAGRILIAGREVTALEPRERGIGYVPQDYALFPHLSVERNIQFGLRAARLDRAMVRRRTAEVAEMLGIAHLLRRRIAGLSGGEQQRTALARALAVEPAVLLLDEPVSALDESTREAVCRELRRLQRVLAVTTIHVSHNLEEAFSVADRGGILWNGRFQQVGPLDEVLRRPRSEFVAHFMRCENLFRGEVQAADPHADTTRVRVGQVDFIVPGRHTGEVRFMIRPENLHLASKAVATEGPGTELPVVVERTVDRGAYVRAELAAAALAQGGPGGTASSTTSSVPEAPPARESPRGVPLVAHLSQGAAADLNLSPGTRLVAAIHARHVHIFPQAD